MQHHFQPRMGPNRGGAGISTNRFYGATRNLPGICPGKHYRSPSSIVHALKKMLHALQCRAEIEHRIMKRLRGVDGIIRVESKCM
mmetsp:Transcript_27860/g.52012  ORF Transcript_27860/g.52012 Transcript_27860/m.52012 type:complete len:85 (-) Transcript_27860:187-441(-)